MKTSKIDPEDSLDTELKKLLRAAALRFTVVRGGIDWAAAKSYFRKVTIEECIKAAEGKQSSAAKMMQKNPKNFGWLIKNAYGYYKKGRAGE